jgi:hypothetical protein
VTCNLAGTARALSILTVNLLSESVTDVCSIKGKATKLYTILRSKRKAMRLLILAFGRAGTPAKALAEHPPVHLQLIYKASSTRPSAQAVVGAGLLELAR